MSDKVPTKSEIFSITQAQSESLEDFSKRFVEIENSLEKQVDRNQSIVNAVLVAFVAIVVTVAVQVLLTNNNNQQYTNSLNEKLSAYQSKNDETIYSLKVQDAELQNELDDLKKSNPYLK